MFNHRLYNQYYPLKTEEEKNALLNSSSVAIYKIARYSSYPPIGRSHLMKTENNFLDLLAHKIMYGEYANITVGELNDALQFANFKKRSIIFTAGFLLFTMLIMSICVYMLCR